MEIAKTSNSIEGLTNTVSHYAIGKTIGEGTFGKVKLGIDLITKQNVAIKILLKSRIVDKSDRERVAREIKILKMVYHPNIIQLYEIIENNDAIYLIMEYASNGELFEHIVKSNKLTEKESAIVFSQILSAIEYLGALGIVHRDLKPENMLFDYQNKIKIVDFGLSTTYTSDQMLKTSCGSPCYASPEMVLGKLYKPLQTDLWSSGVVLFAMLTGALPFEDKSITTLYRKILNGVYVLPAFLSEDAKQIIKGLLVTAPDKRATISKLKKMKFMVSNLMEANAGKESFVVDTSIVTKLAKYFDKNYILDSIKKHKHNTISTIYNLLLNRAKPNEATEVDTTHIKSNTFYDEKEDKSYICSQRPLSKHIRDLSNKRSNINSSESEKGKLNKTVAYQSECSSWNEPQQSLEASNYKSVQSSTRHSSVAKRRFVPSSPQRGHASRIEIVHDSAMAIIKEEMVSPLNHSTAPKFEEAGPKAHIVFHPPKERLGSKRNSMRSNYNGLCNKTSCEITPRKIRKLVLPQRSPQNNQSMHYETECSTSRHKYALHKYDGPLNLCLAFSKKPDEIINKMKRLLPRYNIFMTWANEYNCMCIRGSLRFEVEIMEIEFMESLYYCRLLFLTNADSEAVRLIQDRVLGSVLS
jgi:serine/threonine protein kinase